MERAYHTVMIVFHFHFVAFVVLRVCVYMEKEACSNARVGDAAGNAWASRLRALSREAQEEQSRVRVARLVRRRADRWVRW